jgi:hypothetical protein
VHEPDRRDGVVRQASAVDVEHGVVLCVGTAAAQGVAHARAQVGAARSSEVTGNPAHG